MISTVLRYSSRAKARCKEEGGDVWVGSGSSARILLRAVSPADATRG